MLKETLLSLRMFGAAAAWRNERGGVRSVRRVLRVGVCHDYRAAISLNWTVSECARDRRRSALELH